MRLAISNIAWRDEEESAVAARMAEMGITGVEGGRVQCGAIASTQEKGQS